MKWLQQFPVLSQGDKKKDLLPLSSLSHKIKAQEDAVLATGSLIAKWAVGVKAVRSHPGQLPSSCTPSTYTPFDRNRGWGRQWLKAQTGTIVDCPHFLRWNPPQPPLTAVSQLASIVNSRTKAHPDFSVRAELCPAANRKYYGITVSTLSDYSSCFGTLLARELGVCLVSVLHTHSHPCLAMASDKFFSIPTQRCLSWQMEVGGSPKESIQSETHTGNRNLEMNKNWAPLERVGGWGALSRKSSWDR